MPDLEKLLVILTIDNAQMLRINPKLLETSENMDNQSAETQKDRGALHTSQEDISSLFHRILVRHDDRHVFQHKVITFVFFFELISALRCGDHRRSTIVSK